MVRKRKVRRRASRGNVRVRGRGSYVGSSGDKVRSTKRKIKIVIVNLVLFLVLTLVLNFLYAEISHSGLKSLFGIFGIITAFLSLAFFIILLVFLFLKLIGK